MHDELRILAQKTEPSFENEILCLRSRPDLVSAGFCKLFSFDSRFNFQQMIESLFQKHAYGSSVILIRFSGHTVPPLLFGWTQSVHSDCRWGIQAL